MGKLLVTHQTGPEGKEVKRLYIEEASEISRELFQMRLIDRETSRIAFKAAQRAVWILKKLPQTHLKK